MELTQRRNVNIRGFLQSVLDRGQDVKLTSASVLQAAVILTKLDSDNRWVDVSERRVTHPLFERMSPKELVTLAENAVFPAWLTEAEKKELLGWGGCTTLPERKVNVMSKKPPQGLHNQKSPENPDSSPAMALIRAQARARLLQKSDAPPPGVVRFADPSIWSEAYIQRKLDEVPIGEFPPPLLVFFETVELNADGSPLNDEGDSKNAPHAWVCGDDGIGRSALVRATTGGSAWETKANDRAPIVQLRF
jgi:hypothetical protein